MELKINPEFDKLLGKLTPEELIQLEENILKEGIKEPLQIWNNFIVDGHNRYRIAKKHNLIFDIKQLSFKDDFEVKEWIIKNQFGRRNLTENQKSYLRKLRYENEKNKDSFKGNQYTNNESGSGQNVHNQKTISKLAKEYGVSDKTIQRDYQFGQGVDLISKVNPEKKTEILQNKSDLTKQEIQSFSKIQKEAEEKEKQAKKQAEQKHKELLEKQKRDRENAKRQAEHEAFMRDQKEKERILKQKLEAEKIRAEKERKELEIKQAQEIQRIKEKAEAEAKQKAFEKLKELEAEKQRKKEEKQKLLQKKKEQNLIIQSKEIENKKPNIYHKDCNDYLNTIDDNSVDLLFTDPPYSTDVENIKEFAESWVDLALSKVKKTGRAFICIGAYPEELNAYLNILLKQDKFILDNPLIWTYRNTLGVTPKMKYNLNYQIVLHLYSENSRELDTSITNEMFSVQDINAPDGRQANRYHTWQKPDELAMRLINHTTIENEKIIDCFACTGTFVLMGAKMNRIASGCDLSKENLEIAKQRGANVIY
ncbi:MAG: hypothetical protein GY849_02540 [Deltaproteobacteria bacterium]|nr:hypothetical protein [Deltaproteobacteria bacterium]